MDKDRERVMEALKQSKAALGRSKLVRLRWWGVDEWGDWETRVRATVECWDRELEEGGGGEGSSELADMRRMAKATETLRDIAREDGKSPRWKKMWAEWTGKWSGAERGLAGEAQGEGETEGHPTL